MRNVIVFCSTGYCGEDSVEPLQVPDFYDEDWILSECRQLAMDNASMYGREVGDLCDDTEEEYSEDQVDYFYEEYDPDHHDQYRGGGGSFAEDFENV